MSHYTGNNNIIFHALDPEIFEKNVLNSNDLQNIIKRGNSILPNFDQFVFDVFLCFYKAEAILNNNNNKTAKVYRSFLKIIINNSNYKSLRNYTFLDNIRSGITTLVFIDDFLNWLKDNQYFSKKSILDILELNDLEDQIKYLNNEQDIIKSNKQNIIKEDILEKLNNIEQLNDMEINRLESTVNDLYDNLNSNIENNKMNISKAFNDNLTNLENDINDLYTATYLSIDFDNAYSNVDTSNKIDLANKLIKNDKLKKITDMLGKLNDIMRKELNNLCSTRKDELYTISIGNDVGRIISSEILKLANQYFRKDFYKKFLEGQLQQYELKEENSKGPFIICLDCSSSMQGEKEIWSKAMALTLSEIASRQRRKCDIIAFTSNEHEVKHINIKKGAFKENYQNTIIEIAEYFPGGGTGFENPLDKALKLINKSMNTNSDIAFITDGDAVVNDQWLEEFNKSKKELNIEVYSILIDLHGKENTQTINKFSDRLTTIQQLTSEESKTIFKDLN